jgi:uncharacterized membrane protein YeaQ/YmgE (transglycosylase-associated protein family)
MPLLYSIIVGIIGAVAANRLTHKFLDLIGTSKEGDFRKLLTGLATIAFFLAGFSVVAVQYIRLI